MDYFTELPSTSSTGTSSHRSNLNPLFDQLSRNFLSNNLSYSLPTFPLPRYPRIDDAALVSRASRTSESGELRFYNFEKFSLFTSNKFLAFVSRSKSIWQINRSYAHCQLLYLYSIENICPAYRVDISNASEQR